MFAAGANLDHDGDGDKGDIKDLTGKVDEAGNLSWAAPGGKWQLYAVFQRLIDCINCIL